MKRMICVAMLLALAAVIMPVMFIGKGAGQELNKGTELLPVDNSPAPSQTVEPSPDVQTGQTFSCPSDEETVFTVLENGNVRDVTMAEHLPFVLAAEMPVSFALDALKAQAVAARTYILYCTKHDNPKHPEADICSQAGCCLAYTDEASLRAAWGDKYEENMAIISEAVKGTDGQVLCYGESPILASFHSSSAGKTEDGSELWGDVPYLVCVSSPETAEDVPNFVTTVEVTKDNLRETVLLLKPEAVFSDDPATWVGETELDESGRVRTIEIGGQKISGSEMRKLFSLRSTCFKLELSNKKFIFTVTGYGHGLGLSQYGANVMAKNGFEYKEILEHYYPNTEIS